MGGGAHYGFGSFHWVAGLEDAGADKDAFSTQAHHHSGIGGGGKAPPPTNHPKRKTFLYQVKHPMRWRNRELFFREQISFRQPLPAQRAEHNRTQNEHRAR